MTAEEAMGPKPDSREGCKQEGFSWSGGRASGTTMCTGAGGGGDTIVVTMDGEYGPTRLRLNMKSTIEGDMPMAMEIRVTGRRIGACPENEQGS